MEFAIQAISLTKRFGRLKAVDGLSFSVPRGAIFGLLGPNGAGKTTTFSMLCGFIRPTSGDATILGEPLKNLDRVRTRVSALPQDAQFHPMRRVRDVMLYFARLGGMDASTAPQEVDRVLGAVGMRDAASKKGKVLSHGMAKRLGVAQAFLGNPELVLLDEPTEGLDPKAAHTVRSMIRTLAARRTTVLVSSHNLAEVQDLCDYAAIIDHGKLVQTGTMAELTQAGEVVIIRLGTGSPDPSQAILALPQVWDVQQLANGIRIGIKPQPGESVEQVITAILHTAIENKALISEVVRGRSLEERYLEIT